MKRFSILDNKTGEPYAGLRHLPADHAQMMMLAPDKPFGSLDLWEKTTARARGDVVVVVREDDAE